MDFFKTMRGGKAFQPLTACAYVGLLSALRGKFVLRGVKFVSDEKDTGEALALDVVTVESSISICLEMPVFSTDFLQLLPYT